jgi:steroid delta-isomerase-like uncharacterized protein
MTTQDMPTNTTAIARDAALALAYRFADTLNSRDVESFDDYIADDYVNHNPFAAPGRAGVKAFFAGFLDAFPDLRVTVEDARADGDTVVGRYTYRGTHHGTFLGIPATGHALTMRSIDIWRVRDGLFVEHWDELNTLEVFQQLGVIPPLG